MTDVKWWENFKGVSNNVSEEEFKFSNEMELEIKYGRDLFNSEYRDRCGMVNFIDYNVASVSGYYGG